MPSLSQDDRDLIYKLRCEDERSWPHIHSLYPDQLKDSLRRVASDERKKRNVTYVRVPGLAVPIPVIEGETIEYVRPDEKAVWDEAIKLSDERFASAKRKQENRITFSHGPVCLVSFADMHAGSPGTDYARIDHDAQIIHDTAGMYAVSAGDIVDNFIIGKLRRIRNTTKITVREEWVLARRILALLGPKLVASVAGNHDLWTDALSGLDYLEDLHKELNPDILYTQYDLPFILSVGANEFRIRVRHKWRGFSQYNDTHGIEKASKFDKGNEFDVGVGAHTHASGLYRQFNNGGRTGHAILCGSYKVYDDYPDMLGLPKSNESAAVAMVYTESGAWGTNDLEIAADYMRTMYKG